MSYFRTSDGTKIAYHERGEGRPLVFIPGWAMSRNYFRRQLEDLSNEFRVIAIDPRGLGDSDKETGIQLSIDLWAGDLSEFLIGKHLTGAVLMGWSMGSFVAWSYLKQFGQENLGGLVVIEMVANLGEPGWAANENANMEQGYHQYMAGFIPQMFHVPPPASDLRWMIEESTKTPMGIAQHLNLLLENADFADVLPTIRLPTLIAYGQYPLFFTEEQKEKTKSGIPHARVEVLENTKHVPFWEAAPQFNAIVRQFTRSLK